MHWGGTLGSAGWFNALCAGLVTWRLLASSPAGHSLVSRWLGITSPGLFERSVAVLDGEAENTQGVICAEALFPFNFPRCGTCPYSTFTHQGCYEGSRNQIAPTQIRNSIWEIDLDILMIIRMVIGGFRHALFYTGCHSLRRMIALESKMPHQVSIVCWGISFVQTITYQVINWLLWALDGRRWPASIAWPFEKLSSRGGICPSRGSNSGNTRYQSTPYQLSPWHGPWLHVFSTVKWLAIVDKEQTIGIFTAYPKMTRKVQRRLNIIQAQY